MARRLSILVVLALMAAACGADDSASANSVSTERELVRLSPGGGEARELPLGAERPLRVADRVGVDEAGEAHLHFADFLLVRLFRDSELLVEGTADPGAPPWAKLRLDAGCVFSSLTPTEAAQRRVTITTEWATVEAIATQFMVYAGHPGDATWVVVKEGAVDVTAAGVTVTVPAGYQTWVEPGEPPVPPVEASRTAVGDRFPRLEDLTGGAVADDFLLAQGEAEAVATLSTSVEGPGRVSGPGILCGTDCTGSYEVGTEIVLEAEPAPDAELVRWSGACRGSGITCRLTVTDDTDVAAEFRPLATTETLRVATAGDGTGLVVSDPPGISCGDDCTHEYEAASTIVLTAIPAAGSIFDGWAGACSGAAPTCPVVMTSAAAVTARFLLVEEGTTTTRPDERSLLLTVYGSGTGVVASDPAGISCGDDCSHDYLEGTTVVLTADPGAGSEFGGWGGACRGGGLTCRVTLTVDRSVTARFDPEPPPPVTLAVAVTGEGAGVVVSDPAGISCGSDCRHEYPFGTVVELTARAAAGSDFGRWTGACSGTGPTCRVTLTDDTSVTARFDLVPELVEPGTMWVRLGGQGTGVVVSDPAGISCGDDCSHEYDHGTTVTLTPTPTGGSTFAGWGGACGEEGRICRLTIAGDVTVTAFFEPPVPESRDGELRVTVTGDGDGVVVSDPAGINCGDDCSEVYGDGTRVVLTADPARGSRFGGWGGACSGTGTTCRVTIVGGDITRVSADFEPGEASLAVTLTGDGSGWVASDPAGISCGSDCSHDYPLGTTVELVADPTGGSTFGGWGGACSGTAPTCQVTVRADTRVSARFERPPPPPEPPKAPSGLHVASWAGGLANMGFVDNADNEDGFHVYMGGQRVSYLGPNSTTFTLDAGCEPQGVYVTAYNSAGESAPSNTITIQDSGDCVVPPAAPSGLHVASWAGGLANMGFVDNADNEDGFHVYMGGQRVSYLGPNSTTFTLDAGCEPQGVYVTAYNSAGESAPSNTITIQDSGDCGPPERPSSLQVTSWDGCTPTFGFADNSDDENGFHIYVDGGLFSYLGPGVNWFTLPDDYWYSCSSVWVTAFNDAGESAPSNTVFLDQVPGNCCG